MVIIVEMVIFGKYQFLLVPGHAEVKGNERANRLAGTAVISDGRVIDHADVLHALRKAGRVEYSVGDKELSTMERLKDGQVKLGAARYKQYAGRKRQIVNQRKTDTVSCHTSF
jgi:hypothetical protein